MTERLSGAAIPNINANNLANSNISGTDLGSNIVPPSGANGPINLPGAAGGQPRTEDLMKSLPQLAAMLGSNGGHLENMDLTKLPPEIIRYVAQGGQIPGVSKETMQLLTQRYIMQMAAKNGANSPNTATIVSVPQGHAGQPPPIHPASSIPPSSVTIPTPIFISFGNGSSVGPLPVDIPLAGLSSLPPLNVIPPELIQKVLNGGTIPGFTQEQTEAIKRRYMQQVLTAGPGSSTTPPSASVSVHADPITTQIPLQQFSPSAYFNFTDLQSLNIDLSKIPPEVIRDLAAGRTPDFGKIPEDIIRVIMEKRPKLFGEIVSRELRTKTGPNGTRLSTDSSLSSVDLTKKRPSYDVNDLDKKADISVLGQELDSQQVTIWTAVALGAIGAVTIIAVAVLCWRRRVRRMQRRASRQTQNEDTSDTSKFFEQMAKPPEPASRRSKVQFDDASKPPVAPATGAIADLMFLDQANNRVPNSPFGLEQTNRPGGPIFSLDSTNRLNGQHFNFDPLGRAVPGQQYRNASMPSFPAQQHFSPPPPPLPNHGPSRTALFDHSTGAWMFMTPNGGATGFH